MSVDWSGVPVIVGNDETRRADQRQHERGQWIGLAALIGGMIIGAVCGAIGGGVVMTPGYAIAVALIVIVGVGVWWALDDSNWKGGAL